MFTGLVEETGRVLDYVSNSDGRELIITANKIEFNQIQKLMKATGNVQVYFDDKIIIAKSIKYFQIDLKCLDY